MTPHGSRTACDRSELPAGRSDWRKRNDSLFKTPHTDDVQAAAGASLRRLFSS